MNIVVNNRIKAFTLIELLVVVAIIGILATVVVVNVSAAQSKSRVAKVRSDLIAIDKASDLLLLDTGQRMFHYNADWSSSCTVSGSVVSCAADGNSEFNIDKVSHSGLIQNDTADTNSGSKIITGVPFPNWNGPYLPSIPKDPWGISYFFDPDYVCSSTVNGCEGRTTSNRVVESYGPNISQNYGDEGVPSDDIVLILNR